MTAIKKTNAKKPDDRAAPTHMEVEAHLLLPSLSQNEVTILAETFRLLGDPSRLKILLSCVPAPISVGDIAERLDLSVTLVSHHLRLLRGAGVAKDPAQARALWQRAAAQGHARSQHALGLALAHGHGGDADLPGALEQFRRAAEQGLLEAQLQAAQLHLRHDGPAPDLVEAEHWLRLAAAQGSDKARELIAALGFDDAQPPTLGERIDGWTGRLIDRVVDGIADFGEARRARRRS